VGPWTVSDRDACIAVLQGRLCNRNQPRYSTTSRNVVEESVSNQQPGQRGTRPVALTRYYGQGADEKVEQKKEQ
jgi:hypothetical protein